jgi:nucleotide-binding universal stress UspA family protein
MEGNMQLPVFSPSSTTGDGVVVRPDEQCPVFFRNILFATDFSSCSEAALTRVSIIAKALKSRVYLIHVMAPSEWQWIPPEVSGASAREQQRRFAEERIARLAGCECLRHVSHQTLIEEGRTWNVLARIISQHEIDLLVIGTHGRTGIEKLALGSVAQEVLRSAACPVLTVGPCVFSGTAKEEHQEILFVTDFTAFSDAAAPYAIALANALRAHLTLLHVGPDPHDMFSYEATEISRSATARLKRLVAPNINMYFAPDCAVEFGSPASSILKFASRCKADLIVLGVRRGGRAFARTSAHLPAGIAYKTVCEAHCPVLTVQKAHVG